MPNRTLLAGQFLRRRSRWMFINAIVLCCFVAFLVSSPFVSCGVQVQKRTLTQRSDWKRLDRGSPFLKAHMRDGSVYVLSEWAVDDSARTVSGTGKHLDINRRIAEGGAYTLAIDSVAIFETNRVQASPYVAGMAIMTGISAVVTIICISTPKACFGSCPTFYVSDGDDLILQAEGFSSAVAPSLEKHDIDALYRARPSGRTVETIMKNEALETHVVRYAHMLALPHDPEDRVFVTSEGEFYSASHITPLLSGTATEEDCTEALRKFDGIERCSLADSTDLATRETIDLTFAGVPDGDLGLVVAARQSLMSTYLFYQTLACMGSSAVSGIAELERGGEFLHTNAQAIGHLLGGIDVQIADTTAQWITVGTVGETGPLATDTRIVPLGCTHGDSLTVRVRLTRGHWRLDYIALVQLGDRVEPLRLTPVQVLRHGGIDDRACRLLSDSADALVTLPGDAYTLVYQLPKDGGTYELFLDSRGYYLEWMRDEWLAEENPARAYELLTDPEGALRTLAPEFKKAEPKLEEIFWNSRYVRH